MLHYMLGFTSSNVDVVRHCKSAWPIPVSRGPSTTTFLKEDFWKNTSNAQVRVGECLAALRFLRPPVAACRKCTTRAPHTMRNAYFNIQKLHMTTSAYYNQRRRCYRAATSPATCCPLRKLEWAC